MDYTNAMMVWDAVSVRIADVCHGTIAREQMELTSENALLLFVLEPVLKPRTCVQNADVVN